MAAEDNKLFVYGSLAPGESNEWVLQDLPGVWQPAWVRGIRHAEGLPTTEGFPVLILSAEAPWVAGQLFTSVELANYWPQVDKFEGPAYRRVVTEVRLSQEGAAEEQWQRACVYVFNEDFSG